MKPAENEPIRIARVITRLGVGGAALHVALLTKHLDSREFETRLFAGKTNKVEGNMLALRGETTIHPQILPHLGRDAAPARDLRALRDLTRQFRRFRPDLVDTHLSKAGFIGRLAAKIAGVPSLHTFHINIFGGYDWKPSERLLYLRLEQIAARWSERLICLSDELGKEILARGIGTPNQFRTVALGLDLEPFEPIPQKMKEARAALRRELGLAEDAILIGHISRLAPVKSVKTFVRAAHILRKTHPEITFLVIGDGETRARLESLSRDLQLGENLRFLGVRADIPNLNLALDAVALTSLQEGTPISIIESLAAARPVVANDVGGVSRLIENEKTGLLTPSNSPESVACALQQLIENPHFAAELGQKGREKMRREFDVSRMIAEHRALYLEVLRDAKVRAKKV
ncbi:Glycosyltransferase involved in cell wall bisynthesis [Abditibacterium utsteinense]|uniref:Glycosyltransferase involved in cell wall bisynthesis n=1 Tax=Abditibacterium utsteinense TaxID=1960156 RepID=A0A2S8SRI2_9BACT|nr:glycosyltransferase family 4 protein [Abditibacterium utsteinense]PQV63386.1 Glycosyltransferase involved in cell wall bisynthesis [Abditibacterium utsteinense]